MTIKVVNVPNGDYKVVTRNNGNVTFDVGNDGLVYISGDLEVAGDVTTISSETLTVTDNIIRLNVGDPGDATGISSALDRQSGIEINRGTVKPSVFLVLDDEVSHVNALGASVNGTFSFINASSALVGIQTCSINSNGQNLYLINAPGTGVVSVSGTTDYERNMFDYDAWDLDGNPRPILPPGSSPVTLIDSDSIPNAQALKDYIDSNLYYFTTTTISEFDTSVTAYDTEASHAPSRIEFTVDGSLRAEMNAGGLEVDNINVFTDTINNTTNNLILTATTTDVVEVNAVFQLDDTGLSPTSTAGATKIYTVDSNTTPAPGKTGIYFTNQGNSDELVAKNRALLFSILF